jgi:hypothetical protein
MLISPIFVIIVSFVTSACTKLCFCCDSVSNPVSMTNSFTIAMWS